MAAKKSNRRQLSTHAAERKSPARQRQTSHPRRGGVGRPLAAYSRERTGGKSADRTALNRSEIIRLLSESLALQRTIGVAMREFEDHPTFGDLCVAFNQALAVLGRAHSEVGRLLERRA